ncbi:hypothetical protein, partial [Helicobacter pylori]|uniref:hypothetical protein n=1 Tax=Helicobacter pylori TaxID=210 RepID=UPI001179D719
DPPNPPRPLFISYRLIKIKLFNIFEFFSFDCEKSSIIPTIKWCWEFVMMIILKNPLSLSLSLSSQPFYLFTPI